MPYKDLEKRRIKKRERQKQKVQAVCYICGGDAFVRKDTLYKYKNVTCSKNCKSILLKRCRSTLLYEDEFIKSYSNFECGYETLCKKYKISIKRGMEILKLHNIKIKTANEIKSIMMKKGLGGWIRAEMRKCKNCNKEFKYRKGATFGLFCSHNCYMGYSGRTSIEEKIAILLINMKIDHKEQYKIKRSYFDFFLPDKSALIECDGKYWHSLPKSVIRDKYKNNLAEQSGFELLRFSEFDINNNLNLIKEKLCSL